MSPQTHPEYLLHDSSLLNTQFFVFFPRGSQALVAKKVKKENMAKRWAESFIQTFQMQSWLYLEVVYNSQVFLILPEKLNSLNPAAPATRGDLANRHYFFFND